MTFTINIDGIKVTFRDKAPTKSGVYWCAFEDTSSPQIAHVEIHDDGAAFFWGPTSYKLIKDFHPPLMWSNRLEPVKGEK